MSKNRKDAISTLSAGSVEVKLLKKQLLNRAITFSAISMLQIAISFITRLHHIVITYKKAIVAGY